MEILFIVCAAIQVACVIAIGVLLLWRRKTKKK
jgi:hypothetical protein